MVVPRSIRAGGQGACAVTLAACVLLTLSVAAARGQQQAPNAAIELVDSKVLRVCADPHNLPFSNEAGEGFENQIAALLGRKLDRPVAYTYYPQVIGFYRNTLNAYRCDVVIGVALGDDLVKTTSPYYHTAYALIFKPGADLDDLRSLADPRLHDKRIGVIAGTPPATIMAENGLMARAKPYPLTVDTRVESPARNMVQDITTDRIDVGVLWGPIAGYQAKLQAEQTGQQLKTVLLIDEKGGHMDFRIAMGVRRSDEAWKHTLDQLIQDNRAEIDRILADYGVPLLDEQGKPSSR
jgi:quinoprotein dehydrogenase-associated probable ABC transporter substrate-binding protein